MAKENSDVSGDATLPPPNLLSLRFGGATAGLDARARSPLRPVQEGHLLPIAATLWGRCEPTPLRSTGAAEMFARRSLGACCLRHLARVAERLLPLR